MEFVSSNVKTENTNRFLIVMHLYFDRKHQTNV